MNKSIYLLFLFACSSLAATTTSYTTKKSGTTTSYTTKKSNTTTPYTTKKSGSTTRISTTGFSSSTASSTKKTITAAVPTKTATTPSTSTSTKSKKYTADASPTPLPNSLSEKVDYQIYQTRLLTSIAEDNRLALKRLTSMMSHLLDNNIKIMTNQKIDKDRQYIETRRNLNQVIHPDNDTLHVSFGVDADPDRYPWAVALRGNDRDRCGGTLIDDQHVLTAAHCIGTSITTVSLGSHLYNGGEEVKTSFYCVHNAYSSSNYYRNDIAIIRLTKPVSVQLPKRVSTIKLCNRSNTVNVNTPLNTVNLWMVGWGLKNNDIEPDELQEAQVTLADRSMCKGSNRYTDMCVQSRSNTSPMGACTGDSGSGLFQQTILSNNWCVLGVASSSNTNICQQTQFTTYVQAASQDYIEWFKDVTDRKKTFDDLQKSERCKSRTLGQEFCRWYAC